MATQTTPAPAASNPDPGGPASILQLQASNLAELRDAVRRGLPYFALEALTKQRELSPQESDRVYRVTRVETALDGTGGSE